MKSRICGAYPRRYTELECFLVVCCDTCRTASLRDKGGSRKSKHARREFALQLFFTRDFAIMANIGPSALAQGITFTPPLPPPIQINEVESNGGVPGDWVELINNGSTPVDISGWRFLDNDDTHVPYVLPSGSLIPPRGYLVLEEAAFGFGLGAPDSVRLFDSMGALYQSYSWTTHATTAYGRCPNGTGAFMTTASVTKGAANDCGSLVKINEVESNEGTPGDWVELYNPGASAADISGFIFRDSDESHSYSIPAGTRIPAGGYYVLEEAAFGFALDSSDSVRLFDRNAAPVDSYTWTAHATTTYGRCPNGTGSFTTTTSFTKGSANSCPGDAQPWPGEAEVQT